MCAMVPIAPKENVLMTLSFGGAVLCSLDAPSKEVYAILEAKRKEVLQSKVLNRRKEVLNYVRVPRRRTAPDRANIALASARRLMLGPPTNDADQADATSPPTS